MTLSNSPSFSYDFDLKDYIENYSDLSEFRKTLKEKQDSIILKYFEEQKGEYFFKLICDKNSIFISTDGSEFSLKTLDLVYRTFAQKYKLPRYLDGRTGLQLNDKLFSNTIHIANKDGLSDQNLDFILKILIAFSKFYHTNYKN